MKKLKTNSKGYFICEICGKPIKSSKGFGNHLMWKHDLKSKDYYI